MYVKIVNGNDGEEQESQIFECEQVKFKKITISAEDKEDEAQTKKAGIFNTLFSPPEGKPCYEAILVTLNHEGDIKRFVAPESTMFILNSTGKTIDVQRCVVM